MADKKMKTARNVDGPYYVDESCIQCGNCVSVAPENFDLSKGFASVDKQPENGEEIDNCQQALEECPVSAIGDDGKA